MNRLTDAWFEFKGVPSYNAGLRLMRMPRRYSPVKRGIREEVPGRDGYIWIPENAYAPIDISVECESADGYNIDQINEWLLNGDGWLRFSDDPNRAYKARVLDSFSTENKFISFDRKRFTIPFHCQPFRYEYPESAAVSAMSGYINNPGTADSLPRIAISATGDYTITVGTSTIDVTGGSVVIDSELRDCFSRDGYSLANSRVSMDEFPQLTPGTNYISWSGSVSNVEVLRRVRYL